MSKLKQEESSSYLSEQDKLMLEKLERDLHKAQTNLYYTDRHISTDKGWPGIVQIKKAPNETMEKKITNEGTISNGDRPRKSTRAVSILDVVSKTVEDVGDMEWIEPKKISEVKETDDIKKSEPVRPSDLLTPDHHDSIYSTANIHGRGLTAVRVNIIVDAVFGDMFRRASKISTDDEYNKFLIEKNNFELKGLDYVIDLLESKEFAESNMSPLDYLKEVRDNQDGE